MSMSPLCRVMALQARHDGRYCCMHSRATGAPVLQGEPMAALRCACVAQLASGGVQTRLTLPASELDLTLSAGGPCSDAAYVRGAVGDVIGLMLQNVMCLGFGYLIAFIFNWRMALVVTGILPLLISSSIIYHKFASGFSSDAGGRASAGMPAASA
jgi:ABC-type multidrug transport system fused ATPase/permease subunit